MDAEIRKREEAGALEAYEAQLVAASAAATGRRVKKEPGRAFEVGSALKIENPDSWNDAEDERDPPKPLVRRAGAKTRSRRKKQKKNSKQEPASWKKPRGHCSASSEDPEAADGESMETSECIRSSRKPCVKQEELAFKKPVERRAWKFPRNAAQDAEPEAGGPAAASESDQDGGRDGPPKKKAMGWASAKSPASGRKKKKVSLGPVSYVLVDVEDAKKKPPIPKKGPGSRRGAAAQKAPRGPQPTEAPASTSQGAKAKPEGSPHGERDDRRKGEERERQVAADESQGPAHHVVSDEAPSAVEEVGDTAVEVAEGQSPDLAPRSP
ncbi:PNMA-like protein 1 [Pteropus alecto]|uniref:PNMA-like protein 1 n=1 Tax=Pteropus alecto TaxID=9402 RepID=L5KNA7_PTEAL|nr:PNMA-like protein 1 [Pteropus alecto]